MFYNHFYNHFSGIFSPSRFQLLRLKLQQRCHGSHCVHWVFTAWGAPISRRWSCSDGRSTAVCRLGRWTLWFLVGFSNLQTKRRLHCETVQWIVFTEEYQLKTIQMCRVLIKILPSQSSICIVCSAYRLHTQCSPIAGYTWRGPIKDGLARRIPLRQSTGRRWAINKALFGFINNRREVAFDV